ncbi:putative suppressor of cytokine signaling 2, partial [Operophtera brumata]
VACCPNCRHELRVSLTPAGKCHAPHTPPPFTIQPYLPHYTTPSVPVSPPYNDELRRLADTLRALRLSGWRREPFSRTPAWARSSCGTPETETSYSPCRCRQSEGPPPLDCDVPMARYMPRFRCVVELVQHYTRVGARNAAGTVWVDREGCPHSPVLLKNPMRKSPPSLLHASRLAIHKALDSNPLTPKLWCAPKHRLLPLPSSLIDYLGEYPYSI